MNVTKKVWRNAEGKPHRGYDLPAIIRKCGTQEWYLNGLLHRNGGKPAIIHVDGSQEWYLHGEKVTEKRAKYCAEIGLDIPLNPHTVWMSERDYRDIKAYLHLYTKS